MNTTKQSLTDNRENEKVDETLISHASLRTSVRSSIPVARARQWQPRFLIFLLPLGGLALIVYQLHAVPTEILRQQFEGFGIAICVVACGGILLWRVFRSFVIEENIQTQLPTANPSPVSPSEPNPAESQKIQRSIPPEMATVPVTPVASFPVETRT